MSDYKGTPVTVARPAADVFARITDFSQYEAAYLALPEEQRAKLQNVTFTRTSFSVAVPQIGELKFEIKEVREPDLVVYQAANSPMPLNVEVRLKPLSDTSTEITPVVSVKLPAMLEAMVGGKLREAAGKLGELFTLFLG